VQTRTRDFAATDIIGVKAQLPPPTTTSITAAMWHVLSVEI